MSKRIFGRVAVTITGLMPERTVTVLTGKGIRLYDCGFINRCTLTAQVDILQYNRLKHSLPQGVRLVRTGKSGVLPLFYGLRKRIGLYIGGALCIALLILLNNRILFYTVSGCTVTDESLLLSQVRALVAPFSRPGGEQLDAAEGSILQSNPSIKWINITRKGARLYITVKDDNTPQFDDYLTPADIVAEKAAVIEEITVTRGTAECAAGDLVAAGQTLISGKTYCNGILSGRVAAEGSVTARVWYSTQRQYPLQQTVYVNTGNTCTVEYICFLGQEFLIGGECTYQSYRTETSCRCITTMGLPIVRKTVTCYQTQAQTRALTVDEVTLAARQELAGELVLTLPQNAMQTASGYYVTQNGDNTVTVSCYIETREHIGISVKVQ